MRIEGIGTINRQIVAASLTTEGREAWKTGELTDEEAGAMYKLAKVKQASRIGRMADTFTANYNRIPISLKDKLSPAELAELTDAFYAAYSDGVAYGKGKGED